MKYIDRNVVLDFASTSCKDVFNSPRKVSLFNDVILQHLHRERQHFPTLSNVIQKPVHVFCGVLKIKNFLTTSPSGRAPDADQSQEANLFVEELLVR